MRPLNRFGPMGPVVAPFGYQPTRQGLRGGFGSLGTGYSAPVGAGAGAGAETGASQGAAIGSSFGPIGTAIGAVAGAIGGAIAGSINKKDPEQYNFDQAVALWSANSNAVFNIGNKYLVLAGLFDLNLKNPHIPIYLRYGHMGEQKFVQDMVNVIYQAAMNGQITPADTANTVMSRIVQPWIDSWGYGPMQDPHADLIQKIILGMVAEYLSGQEGNWVARSGVAPNWSLPPFPIQHVLGQQSISATAPAPPTNAAPVIGSSGAINPVGSAVTTTAPTPMQLVASPPAIGTTVAYAPDKSQAGAPMGLPSGLEFVGTDPYNGSWVLQNGATGQLYVLWQGALEPYTSSLFAPAAAQAMAPSTSGASVVTGSGTTGGNTMAPLSTDQTSTDTTAPTGTTTTTAGIGWLLGLSIVGTLFLARPAKGHKRADY
jgi:hypothetical protein